RIWPFGPALAFATPAGSAMYIRLRHSPIRLCGDTYSRSENSRGLHEKYRISPAADCSDDVNALGLRRQQHVVAERCEPGLGRLRAGSGLGPEPGGCATDAAG